MKALGSLGLICILLASPPAMAAAAGEINSTITPAALAEAGEAVKVAAVDATTVESSAARAAGAVPAARAVSAASKLADPPPPPEPTLFADINLNSQTLTVSEGSRVLHTWPISSGTRSHPTETGTFRGQWTAKMWYSRKYDWAPMPHAVFFNGGTAVHATYATGALGRPASHGCIRLSPANAKVFYNLVQKHGTRRTKFVVHGVPNFKNQAIAARTAPRVRQQRPDSIWGSLFGYADDPSPAQIRAQRRQQLETVRAQRRALSSQRRAQYSGY